MAFDSLAFRKALGQFATGVTVLSVLEDDEIHGMTANSFTSVSLEPPLVLVCVDKTRRIHNLLQRVGRFGVSILTSEQVNISNWYAGRRHDPAQPEWRLDLGKSPILEGAQGWFDCRLVHVYEGGDHTIFVGEVEGFGVAGGSPLIFFQGRYTRLYDVAD